MGRRKIDDRIEGRILQLLHLNYSYSMIIKTMKAEKIKVSKGLIHAIRHKIGKIRKSPSKRSPLKPVQQPYRIVKKGDIRKLRRFTTNDNPPTQKYMSKVIGRSRSTLAYHIKKTLTLKLVKKARVHFMSKMNIEKRKNRAKPFYNYLQRNLNQIITTDEAWFYLSNCNGKRAVQYIKKSENYKSATKFQKKQEHSKGVMVWAGISMNGKTNIIFVDPGTKINRHYYINRILVDFIDMARVLYPKRNFIFHQDSAPSHTAKDTLKYLYKRRVDFITPEKWLPKSPDLVPMDFFVWGYLKRQLWKHKCFSIPALKRAIIMEWKKLPQNLITRALKSWPKRVLNVHKNEGKYF